MYHLYRTNYFKIFLYLNKKLLYQIIISKEGSVTSRVTRKRRFTEDVHIYFYFAGTNVTEKTIKSVQDDYKKR